MITATGRAGRIVLAAGNSNARPGLAFKNFAAHAQHTAMPMIGFLNGGSSWEYAQMAAAFRKGLGEPAYSSLCLP
jgi:hypothetical protein